MTILQPTKNKVLLNWILTSLILFSVVAAVWLVSLYNHLVNVRHGVAEMRTEIQRIQTSNAELKEQIFSMMDGEHLDALAADRGLVQERQPHYLESVAQSSQWSLASR